MKIKIEKEEKNPLLKRKDIVALIDHEGGPTPSKDDIRKKLSAEKGWDINKIEIKYVHSIYGSPFSKSIIKVWDKPQERLTPKEKSEEVNDEVKEEKEPKTENKEEKGLEEKGKAEEKERDKLEENKEETKED